MTNPIKILAFAGATRKGSLNKKLLQVAVAGARKAGAEVTVIDFADYPIPLYDGDLEEASGLPPHAQTFKKLLTEHDGVLIASPEYNSSYSAVLKNAIDWASRATDAKEPALSAFRGKYAGLVATSQGALGGLRGLFALRELLQNINVTVLPGMQAVGQGQTQFDDDGNMKDEKLAANVAGVGAQLVETLKKIRAG